MGETIVEARHLSHRYATQWAIQDINFEISQRGILGLLGSNGAGKSTTMNIICGGLEADRRGGFYQRYQFEDRSGRGQEVYRFFTATATFISGIIR